MFQEVQRLPRLLVAAPQGRSGKTTVALGLCAVFRARGLKVQPYKKGADYIDPSWLSEAAGRPCRSLDPFFYEQPKRLAEVFARASLDADISVVEGNHGLYDSFDETGDGSSAAVARALDAPILLVLNAARMGRSAAALIYGYQNFEHGLNFAGVILNNVAHGRHEARMKKAIESYCRIPVLGAIPRDDNLAIPDRHLGLIPRGEGNAPPEALEACQRVAETRLDLARILKAANAVPFLNLPPLEENQTESNPRVKIGVIRDRAFTFYYPENLEALEKAGAEIIFIDAINDERLPAIDSLYIGGGFPEIFMDELSANVSMRRAVRQAIEDDLPVYAECGGMMYLSRRIVWNDKSAEMVGALPCEIAMTDKPQGHGYVAARVAGKNPFFEEGTLLRGHEFHNSRLALNEGATAVYALTRGNGLGESRDGIAYRNVLASYMHLHVGGAEGWARALTHAAHRYRLSRGGESR